VQAIAEDQPLPRLQPLGRGAEAVPLLAALGRDRLHQQQFHLSAGAGLVAAQPRRDHPGVVEDQQIARAQQLRQLPDGAVLGWPLKPREHQQAGGVALRQGSLGDPLLRERVVEVGELHHSRETGREAAGRSTSRVDG